MKKLLSIVLLSTLAINVNADVKDAITETTKGFITLGKDLMKGLNDGVDEGRKNTEGVDGAITITNITEMEKHINIDVIKIEESVTGMTVVVGFKNFTDKPVRIANMDDKDIVLIIDNDGYSTGMSSINRANAELTVPPQTGKKHSFSFNIKQDNAASIRLWSKEFDLSKLK